MPIKNYVNYSIIVKNAETDAEIVRSVVTDQIKGQDIIAFKCDQSLFDGIDRTKVIIYNTAQAFHYMGTVRPTHITNDEIYLALYHGEDRSNRSQARYKIGAMVHVLRHYGGDGKIHNDEEIRARLLDVSSGGVCIQTKRPILLLGDRLAFKFEHKLINRVLYAEVVRIANDEDQDYQYGCALLSEEKAKRYGLTEG